MVSPQNIPVNRGDAVTPVSSTVAAAGRGLVHPEEAQLYAVEGGTIPMPRSYVTWGSVIAGTLVTFSILALLGALGYAVSASMYSGTGPGPSERSFTIGAAIWAAISCIVAFWAGGCVSAYMSSGLSNSRHALLHGVMVWALALPLLAALAGLAQNRGLMFMDLTRMTARGDIGVNPDTGAAWASFIALLLGLVFAAIGGLSAIPMAGGMLGLRRTGETRTVVEQRPG